MMKSILSLTALLIAPLVVGAGVVDVNNVDVEDVVVEEMGNVKKIEKGDIRRNLVKFDSEKLERDRQARMERQRQRRERAREKLATVKPDLSKMHRMTKEELVAAQEQDHPWVRRASWGSNSDYEPYDFSGMADPSQEYDKWQQAYRMLGGFIDCDHDMDDDNHSGSGDNDAQGSDQACSRWMMWAAYIDPNYQGGGYDEYFGDEPSGSLDCHNPETDWEIVGVYRQEFYQFIEQISKHLWAIDEYEYVVALAGLAYMTDSTCFYVGTSNDGESIYAGVAPQQYGKFQMALYTDGYCITPNEDLGVDFDDFGLTSNVALESQDADDGSYNDDDVVTWWTDTQEYTLTQLNDVYESFKYCTSCVDYPTYQDGYFIGDYGTDDDDLINQCWKFYSHDSFTCEGSCIALGHSQGTILQVNYGGKQWGETLSEFYTAGTVDGDELLSTGGESRWTRMMSNVFVTFSFIVFIATFLAFAVARRSRHRERTSGRSRRLLDDDGRKSRRGEPDGDGVFRSSRSKSRSKSTSKSRSKSRSRRDQSSRKSSTYEPPSTKSKSSRKSRRHIDDF